MRKKKRRALMTPDLTPLIDIVFLLLIFFMIVSNFNKYGNFNLELPVSGVAAVESENMTMEVIIDKDKKYFIKQGDSSTEVEPEKLSEYIKDQKDLIVTADKELQYQDVMELLGKIKENSVGSISLSAFQ